MPARRTSYASPCVEGEFFYDSHGCMFQNVKAVVDQYNTPEKNTALGSEMTVIIGHINSFFAVRYQYLELITRIN
jgi:hypothetical protein